MANIICAFFIGNNFTSRVLTQLVSASDKG